MPDVGLCQTFYGFRPELYATRRPTNSSLSRRLKHWTGSLDPPATCWNPYRRWVTIDTSKRHSSLSSTFPYLLASHACRAGRHKIYGSNANVFSVTHGHWFKSPVTSKVGSQLIAQVDELCTSTLLCSTNPCTEAFYIGHRVNNEFRDTLYKTTDATPDTKSRPHSPILITRLSPLTLISIQALLRQPILTTIKTTSHH